LYLADCGVASAKPLIGCFTGLSNVFLAQGIASMQEKNGGVGHSLRGTELNGAAEQDHSDWSILSVLLAPTEHSTLWTIEELGRVLQCEVQALDSVGRLLRDGLIHRQGDFVFPTRAAARFNEIAE
jgi:hypothetical protein